MTTSTLFDVTRIAALPTCAGFGSAQRLEEIPLPPPPTPPKTARKRKAKEGRRMGVLEAAHSAIDRAETLLLDAPKFACGGIVARLFFDKVKQADTLEQRLCSARDEAIEQRAAMREYIDGTGIQGLRATAVIVDDHKMRDAIADEIRVERLRRHFEDVKR